MPEANLYPSSCCNSIDPFFPSDSALACCGVLNENQALRSQPHIQNLISDRCGREAERDNDDGEFLDYRYTH